MARGRQNPRGSHAEHALQLIKTRGLVRAGELSRLGIPRTTLTRLLARGRIERVSRGLYGPPGGLLVAHEDELAACAQVRRGVVCLLSALRLHGIGTQSPGRVWLAIPLRARRPKLEHPRLELVPTTERILRYGVERRRERGLELRVTNPAKTVVDCFRCRRRVGMDVALEALREGRRARRFTVDELLRAARVGRVERLIRPYVEALL